METTEMTKNRKRLKQTEWFSTKEWRPHYSRVGWYKGELEFALGWWWWNGEAWDHVIPDFFKGVIR